jgi:hypothetical protein
LNNTADPAGDVAALQRRSVLLLAVSAAFVLAHAFVPLEQFIHRGDDAFYYFKVALNFPATGFWSFDTIHPTNGVQPLWAMLLTAVATVLSWVGVSDPDLVARIFVLITAGFHVGSCWLLYRLLATFVSPGTGIAAAAAFLLPMGIVWARVWGMENSLYAFVLLGAITYFHTVFLRQPAVRTAVMLGLLLGLTGLSRLNAGVLIPCLLAYWLFFCRGHATFGERFRLSVVAGAAASVVIVPYLVWNLAATGHLLPISGAVKTIITDRFLDTFGLESRFSLAFVKRVYWEFLTNIEWFITSRAVDGLSIVGARAWFSGNDAVPVRTLALLVAAVLAVPFLAGAPGAWLRHLAQRGRGLAPFWYVAVFGVVNAKISVLLYPTQLRYAMIRWWLVENEIVIVAIAATLVMAAVSFLSARPGLVRVRATIGTVALAALVAFSAQKTVRHYWSDTTTFYDWNRSWNDESLKATRWLAENVDSTAIVGSWNAGVLGHYAKQRVVNLDGLINNFELIPYLREGRISDYIRAQGIQYLSDMESMLPATRADSGLKLTVVYSSPSPLMHQNYRIYRVDE